MSQDRAAGSLPGTLTVDNVEDEDSQGSLTATGRSNTPVRLMPLPPPSGHTESMEKLGPAEGQTRKKALPTAVRKRRPSLAEVLGGDSNDPKVIQEMSQKIAEAAAAQASSDVDRGKGQSGSCDETDDDGTGGSFRNPDRLQLIVMPTLTIVATVTYCVAGTLWTNITEPLILSDPPPPVPPVDYNPAIDGEPMQHYVLNEPLGAFIGVVSIIFALMYTSVYNDATTRQSHIRNALAQEAGGVHTAMLLVRTLDADDDVNKTRALLLFSSYIENLATEIFFKSKTRSKDAVLISSIEALYAAVPFLSEIASDGEGDEMDRVLIQRVVDSLNRVTEARHQRESAERGSVSLVTFVFLIMLAMFTFFGEQEQRKPEVPVVLRTIMVGIHSQAKFNFDPCVVEFCPLCRCIFFADWLQRSNCLRSSNDRLVAYACACHPHGCEPSLARFHHS